MSTGLTELSKVRAVDSRYVYRASHWLRIDYVVKICENAGRGRQADDWSVVCISPCELGGVHFLVQVRYFAGAVRDKDFRENEGIALVERTALEVHHRMR